jgi:hypothetical protein
MSDDERPKRSWREIDRRKDKSAHRQEDRSDLEGRGPKGKRREKSYKAALDRLFESGKIAELVEQKGGGGEAQGENRIKALAKIKNAGNRDEVTEAVDAYLNEWNELPDDMEVLGRALEHRNPTWQLDAMERIEKLLETERPKRTRAMVGHLKMIRDIGDDNEMVELAKRLIERLE